jgi:regulator of extracellular matrix RemA (YlzA/DUF370 family)
LLTNCGDFRRQRATSNTAGSVVAHTRVVIDGDIVNDCSRDGAVVHLNIGDGHIVDGPVVVEPVSAPVAALIADSDVTEAVVDASVVANVTAPVAIVVAVASAAIVPVSRRPEIAHFRRPSPRAWDPVISAVRVAPISRRPQIAVAGDVRLRIFRQLRWRFRCIDYRLAVASVLIGVVVTATGIVVRIVI